MEQKSIDFIKSQTMKHKIIEFLKLHHKRAWCMNEQNYDAWIVEALNNSDKGWKHIELKSYETNDGKTKFLDLEKGKQ